MTDPSRHILLLARLLDWSIRVILSCSFVNEPWRKITAMIVNEKNEDCSTTIDTPGTPSLFPQSS